MEEIVKNIYLQFGAMGLLFAVLSYAIYNLLSRLDKYNDCHAKERDKLFSSFENLIKESNESVNRNSLVMTELITIIKSKN